MLIIYNKVTVNVNFSIIILFAIYSFSDELINPLHLNK